DRVVHVTAEGTSWVGNAGIGVGDDLPAIHGSRCCYHTTFRPAESAEIDELIAWVVRGRGRERRRRTGLVRVIRRPQCAVRGGAGHAAEILRRLCLCGAAEQESHAGSGRRERGVEDHILHVLLRGFGGRTPWPPRHAKAMQPTSFVCQWHVTGAKP